MWVLCLATTLLAAQDAAEPRKQSATMAGRVLNAQTGEPLRKALVSIWRESARDDTERSRYSDASGKFEFRDLEPGRYNLRAWRTGFSPQAYGAKRPDWGNGTPITLTAGQEIKDLAISLAPHAVITGHVLDVDGDPLEHIRVSAYRMRWTGKRKQPVPEGSYSETNDLGEYRLAGLIPGSYFVQAVPNSGYRLNTLEQDSKAESQSETVATFYPSATDLAGAVAVDVPAGGEARGIDVRLSSARVFNLRGTAVVALTGKPVRAGIVLRPREFITGFYFRDAETNGADGKFEIRGLPPGDYALIARSSTSAAVLGEKQSIHIGEDDAKDLVLRLHPTVEIHGVVKVVGKRGAELTRARRTIDFSEGQYGFLDRSAEVDEDGAFKIEELLPGRYEVGCSNSEGLFIASAKLGDQDVLENGVEVGGNAGGVLEVVLSAGGAELTGTVQADDGEPLQGATVVLLPEAKYRRSASRYVTGATDRAGNFRLKFIRPGKYSVLAFDELEGAEYMDPDFIKDREKQAVAVTLEEGARQSLQLKVASEVRPGQ